MVNWHRPEGHDYSVQHLYQGKWNTLYNNHCIDFDTAYERFIDVLASNKDYSLRIVRFSRYGDVIVSIHKFFEAKE